MNILCGSSGVVFYIVRVSRLLSDWVMSFDCGNQVFGLYHEEVLV